LDCLGGKWSSQVFNGTTAGRNDKRVLTVMMMMMMQRRTMMMTLMVTMMVKVKQ